MPAALLDDATTLTGPDFFGFPTDMAIDCLTVVLVFSTEVELCEADIVTSVVLAVLDVEEVMLLFPDPVLGACVLLP